jgi:hypothetical protein
MDGKEPEYENESTKSTLRALFKESDELTRILATILRKSQ